MPGLSSDRTRPIHIDSAWQNTILQPGKHFSISPVLLYQDTDYKQFGGQQYWFSAGARPQVYFNNYVNLAFEPFVDWVNDKSTNVSDYLFKMTFAPQVSLGNHFMSRPAIRGFVTYAHWGERFQGASRGPRLRNHRGGGGIRLCRSAGVRDDEEAAATADAYDHNNWPDTVMGPRSKNARVIGWVRKPSGPKKMSAMPEITK